MKRESNREKYLEAAENFRVQEAREEKQLLFLSILRFLCFITGIIFIWFISLQSAFFGILLTLVVLILFLYLLKLYSDHSDKKEHISNLVLINSNEAEALSGNFSNFESGEKYIDSSHDFSYDIDLFGQNSLFQYLNRTVTGSGRDILAGWLSEPYVLSPELLKRQEIIKELSMKETWRHSFLASGMKVPLEESEIAGLLNWMEEEPLFKTSFFKRFLIFFMPAAALISLMLLVSGLLHYSVFTFILFVNLAYITTGIKKTNEIHRVLSGKYAFLTSMKKLLKVFGDELFISDYLKEMKAGISGPEVSAASSVKSLSRLIQSFDSRLNILVGFVLNGLLLWDFHCIYRLENWKSDYKQQFPDWLDILSNVDAYVSLGNFAFNNPYFIYPSISKENILFSSKMLGHPLINESKRVCNDFSLTGNLCIITGANMAGKSTFLRTVAINYVLAMTGSPVCAHGMEFLPVRLFTSMRTTDSLSGNESYFYAELKRLKILKARIQQKEPVFFIIDEILKGTNSADKSMGSKLFIKRLVLLGGKGLVATHDISLGALEADHPGVIINMCFEIDIEGEIIHFDYKLIEGITKKMNAALLMKQMGILD